MKKQLVLASLEQLLKKNCVNYSISSDIYSLKESSLENFKIKVNKSHWSKNSKKKIDYIYLKKLYYSTFKDLTKYLNEYHSINFSEKQWHIILGPWLNYILPILWDRWETVDFFKKKFGVIKSISLPQNNENYIVSRDFNDFIDKSQRQDWNAEIFKTIIDFKKEWKPKYKKKKISKNIKKKTISQGWPLFIDKVLFFFQKIFFRQRNFIFTSSNFEKKFYILIFLKLFIMTRLYKEFDQNLELQTKIEYGTRQKFLKVKNVKNLNFEKYLSRVILRILPQSYLENFNVYLNASKKIDLQCEFVFTAFRHYENDLFKIWVADQKKKLISCLHGGNIEKEFFFDSWSKYSFKYITWNKEITKKNNINLPVNFLLFRKKIHNSKYLKNKKIIFLLPHAEIKPLRLVDGLFCFDILNCLKEWILFYKILKKDIGKNIVWRFGPFKDQWRILEKLKKEISSINISSEKSFTKEALSSKLSIHVDLQTTFLETMYMNIPSVVLMNKNFWNISKKSIKILDSLYKAKILFYNYKDLANHINQNFSHLDNWWQSKNVQNARITYLKYSGITNSSHAKNKWLNFFQKLRNKQ